MKIPGYSLIVTAHWPRPKITIELNCRVNEYTLFVCVCVCESVDDFSHTVGKCMKRMTWSMGPTKTDRDTCDILNEWQNSFYKDPQEEIRKSINFQLKKTNLINME